MQQVRKKCAKIFAGKTHKTLGNQHLTPHNNPKNKILEKMRKTNQINNFLYIFNSTLFQHFNNNKQQLLNYPFINLETLILYS